MRKQFKESLESVVFTTKSIIDQESYIGYIVHNSDGLWEFYDKLNVNENEIKLISLKQMIAIDPSILEVAELPMEFCALRNSKYSTWRVVAKN